MAIPNNSIWLHDPAVGWLWFQNPLRVLQATSPESLPALLEEVQSEVDGKNLYAAGFLSYEAAPAFDPAFKVHAGGDFPVAWFGLYEGPECGSPGRFALPEAGGAGCDLSWNSTVSDKEYESAFREIKEHIRKGETYQVNYSVRLRAPFAGDPWDLFVQMVQAQGAHYGAFVSLEDWAICCASPELFFRLDGTELVSRPMKGTADRGLWPAQDAANAADLQHSEKNRAENIMIVDMVRNDLGRVAEAGSVEVPELFVIEKYPTLWQMTSMVKCATRASVSDIFRALFPAASITGAPKVRTMEIIRDLETSGRRIYTGAIGYIAPKRRAQFNVAIRTVLVDKQRSQAEYGVGGGIVWDSTRALESEECKVKAKVLTARTPTFELLETILWKPGEGYFLLEGHLRRLRESAEYFSWRIDLEEVKERLACLNKSLLSCPPGTEYRVRLKLDAQGKISLESEPVKPLARLYRVRLAERPVNSKDALLYHKTTHRQVYQELKPADCEDVLLWNDKGELTESAIANLVIEKDGRWLTPPISCGLLPGVYREFLLEQGKLTVETMRIQDLTPGCRIFLINSLRGMWPATLNPRNGPDGIRSAGACRAGRAHGFCADRT